jgi:hypothetical protein
VPGWRRAVGVALALACLAGCKRKHVPVDSVPELGFPACGDAGLDETGTVVGQGHLRAGPTAADQNVAERFELRRTSCGYTFQSRQEWPLAISDMEVRFDAALTPIWAWKRLTIAGFIKKPDAEGVLTLEKLLPGGRMPVPSGVRVGAVVGPGRGVITAWLKRERLPVGGKTQELVLDFRDMIEQLEVGTLERNADLYEPSLGKTVRAYTFFGKETVFADENDVVLGDLAGMRPNESLKTPEPPALPEYGKPDPVHTP